VEEVADVSESMMVNHDCARDVMVAISVRYGPARHSLIRSVG